MVKQYRRAGIVFVVFGAVDQSRLCLGPWGQTNPLYPMAVHYSFGCGWLRLNLIAARPSKTILDVAKLNR